MGSKARSWPCGCMSEGLIYCGQNVTALSNKTEAFWMWNLAGVVSPQTRRKVCARVCRKSGGTQGIRKRKMLNQHCLFSSSRGGERGYFRTFWGWVGCETKMENYGSLWGGVKEGGRVVKCGWEQRSVIWSISAPTWEAWVLYSNPNSTPEHLGPNTAFHWVPFSLLVK